MSQKMVRDLIALCDIEERNRRDVQERLRSAGIKANPALVASVAKYYEALEKLSRE